MNINIQTDHKSDLWFKSYKRCKLENQTKKRGWVGSEITFSLRTYLLVTYHVTTKLGVPHVIEWVKEGRCRRREKVSYCICVQYYMV